MSYHRTSAWGLYLALGVPLVYAQTQVDLRTQSKNVDFAAAASTRPVKTGASLPATCQVGELFFRTGVAAGSNLYGCTSTDQWSLEAGGGGGGGSLPEMAGQANKVLGTDGAAAFWRAITTGPTGALAVSHAAGDISLDIVTAVLPQKAAANTFTGLNTFDQGVQLTPMSTPSSPSDGRIWYDSASHTFRCRQNGVTYDCIGSGSGGGGLGDPGSNGVLVRTGLNLTTARTITGTANEIAVTNGDGVAGNPTLALGANFDISGKSSTKPVKAGTAAPASCGVGELFFDTDATAGLNLSACTSANTWTVQGAPDISSSHSWWMSHEWTLVSGQSGTPNTVYLYLKYLTIPQTFEKGSIYIDSAYSGGKARVGVYSVSEGTCGTLLFQTPVLDTGAVGLKTGVFSPVRLEPGWYYMAIAVDNPTVSVRGNAAGTSMNTLRNAGSMKYMGTAINSVTNWDNVGLPSSCGGLTGINTAERAMVFHR